MRALAPFFLLVVAASASADAFDDYVADIRLLTAKPVQKEVGLTEAQRKRLNSFADANRKRLVGIEAKFKGKKMSQELVKQMQTQAGQAFSQFKKQVLGVLSVTQRKRLRELTLQRAGLSALMDARVAQRVGLTGGSLTKYREAFSAGARQAIGAQRAAAQQIAQRYKDKKPKDQAEADRLRAQAREELQAAERRLAPKIQKTEKETERKLLAILTPAQEKAFAALKGKPFRG